MDDGLDPVAEIRRVARDFVGGNLTAPDFERAFLRVFADVPTEAGEDVNAAAEAVFWAVEDYVSDPTVREPGDLDDEALRRVVAATLPGLG